MSERRTATLALYVGCGDLVVSFAIEEIVRVVLGDGIDYAPLDSDTKLGSVRFESLPIPALDLAVLLGMRKRSAAHVWIIATASFAATSRQFALACDRSLAVRPQRLDLPLPPQLFSGRPGAVVGAFETTEIREAAEVAPTGFALSAAHLLIADELGAIGRAAAQGKVTW